jgi:hypothetical protein
MPTIGVVVTVVSFSLVRNDSLFRALLAEAGLRSVVVELDERARLRAREIARLRNLTGIVCSLASPPVPA